MIYRSPDFHSKWTSVFNIHVFSNRSGLYLLPFYVEYWPVGQSSVEIYFNMWLKCCLTLTPLKVICWHSGGCWEANVRKSHVWASLQSQELSLVLRGRQLYECFPEQTWSPLHFFFPSANPFHAACIRMSIHNTKYTSTKQSISVTQILILIPFYLGLSVTHKA